MNIEKRIYRLSALCVVLAGSSLVAPRLVPSSEGGFAASASAVLVLLAMLGISLCLSLYLAVLTVRTKERLSTKAKVAGLGPSVLLAAALAGLFVFLSY